MKNERRINEERTKGESQVALGLGAEKFETFMMICRFPPGPEKEKRGKRISTQTTAMCTTNIGLESFEEGP